MTETTNLGLPFIEASQAQKHVTHNEALRILDALVMLTVLDRDLSAPPATPAEGDRHIVKAPGSGDFAGKDNQIAHFVDAAWTFHAPREGWTCYVVDESALLCWNGTDWEAAIDVLGGVSELQELNRLGVGTSADATNPFAAKLNNALWTARYDAEGGDGTLRYKLNKEASVDTLSILLQTDFSGRAEIGLAGDDDFHFKTSPDGSIWIDALLLDNATGATKVNTGFYLTGDISPAQLTANVNDYNPSGLSTASVLRLASDATRQVTGLSGGGDGRILALVNVGANAIVLKDADGGSAPANRFSFGNDVTLAPKQSATLWYDASDSRWKLLAGPQVASGGGGGPADLDLLLAELALGLADALNVAQFLGGSGNRFADSFDTTTYLDAGGSTNLDTGTAGLIKPTAGGGASAKFSTEGKTRIGDMTNEGGLNAAFDGNASQAVGSTCAKSTSSSGYDNTVGIDFGATVDYAVDRFKLWAPTDAPALTGGTNFKLQGSADNSTWVDLYTSGTLLGSNGASADITSGITTTTPYRYYRVNASGNGSSGLRLAEVEFWYTPPGSTNNITAKSTALTAAAVPTTARLTARAKFVDSVTLGTDLMFDVSRDGGTSWSTFSMNDRFTVNSIRVLESDTLDISSQPSGTSMKWRARTANGKMVEIHDIYLYWT
jgi:hypothetical protein